MKIIEPILAPKYFNKSLFYKTSNCKCLNLNFNISSLKNTLKIYK